MALIVEDERSAQAALIRLFAISGWDVVAVATVAGALLMLDPPPRCIVLDLMLPDGPGEDVLRKVRADGLPTSVVVCTASHDLGRLKVLEGLGPTAVLRKPVAFRDILGACGMAG